jgi:hypothetical protein
MVDPVASHRRAHDTRKDFPRDSAIRRYEDRGGAMSWCRDGAIPPGHGAIENDVQTKTWTALGAVPFILPSQNPIDLLVPLISTHHTVPDVF